MNGQEIMVLANEAELCRSIWIYEADDVMVQSVIRFAKLVAAKEREQLILFLRNLADDHTPSDCADMICALQSFGESQARGKE